MAKKVTLADIAKQVGVSNVAVCKALADKPGVSDEMREKIKKVAAEMGYVGVDNEEKKKSARMTGNIGVIVPEQYYGFSISFYGQLYEKVVKALFHYEYFGILELLKKEDEKEGKLPKVLVDKKVDGLIFLGKMDKEYVEIILNQTRIPVFFLDTYHASLNYDAVVSDGYLGTYMLTNYLIEQGHRKIAFVGNADATSSIADRYWGYRRALRENGIAFQDSWEIPDRDVDGKTYDNVVNEPSDVEAYVCNCDYIAHFVMQNLTEMGYRVPEDVSVVGFDNFLPVGIGMEADRITSYEVDMERMADECVKSLIRKINGKRYVEGVQMITGKIVHKDTVRKRN